jgi:L-amino acid N-acyltransferase YncA
LAEIVFAIEPIAQCWEEFVELAKLHWAETQQYRHDQPLAPSLERYGQVEAMGGYTHFTARVDGKLVGYGGIYIVPSMHTQVLICVEDTWYLHPDYRKGRNAIRFFRVMEDYCRFRGVREVSLTAPAHTKTGRIVEYLGYKEVAKQYSKRLEPSQI